MERNPSETPQPNRPRLATRLAPLGLIVFVVVASLLLHGGSREIVLALLHHREHRELEPALFQAAPLRTDAGGADRIYLLSTQSESVLRVSRRPNVLSREEFLHVDLWAVDAQAATIAWRRRVRSYRGEEREGRVLTGFQLLGVDGTTLWMNVEGPLGVSLPEGRVVADGVRIDARNPRLAGRRVDEPGYVAFGRHGLQLTLDDASQWRIDASDLSAAPRDTPVRDPDGIAAPALLAATHAFQMRALPLGERWLGVLTHAEAEHLRNPPVVPGRAPDERAGVLQRFLEENHVPAPLHQPLPQPYRLWGARVEKVSAAPPEWPKDWPDKWGTRERFSDYAVLPESPAFLRAGLLRPHRDGTVPFWYREPDSVLVLHVDRLGAAGRLHLTRVAGPRGSTVWDLALPFTELASVMHREADLVLWGHEPVANPEPEGPASQTHHRLVRVDVASGTARALDLTAQSLRPDTGVDPIAHVR